jgi:mRNA interferase MazF
MDVDPGVARAVKSRAVHWAHLPPPFGYRPVCILSRSAALAVLTGITVVPITRTVRHIRSEVAVGEAEGLEHDSVIACDNVQTIDRRTIDPEPVGMLSPTQQQALDRAIRYALAIK